MRFPVLDLRPSKPIKARYGNGQSLFGEMGQENGPLITGTSVHDGWCHYTIGSHLRLDGGEGLLASNSMSS